MTTSAKALNKKIATINKFIDYTNKRLAVHEAGHVVIGYLLDRDCSYFQSGLDVKVQHVNDNLEIETNSHSFVVFNYPIELQKVCELLSYGYQLQPVCQNLGLNIEAIRRLLKQYIFILGAGYISESHFYDGLRYWFTKRIGKKNSVDFTPQGLENDITRINMIAPHVGIDPRRHTAVLKNIISTKEISRIILELADKSYSGQSVHHNEIVDVLKKSKFDLLQKKFASITY